MVDMRSGLGLCWPSLLVAAVMTLSIAGAEELIFFADDHYKVIGRPELQASAVNPTVALEPGRNCSLGIILANRGRIEELIPINGNGSEADIALELEEEQRSVDAQNITVRLSGDGQIKVASGPTHISSLPSGSVAAMEFELHAEDKASGWHDLLMDMDYEHQVDVSVFEGLASPLYQQDNASQSLKILVQESEGPVRILGVKSDISQGSAGSIMVAIKNSGDEALRNCSLRLIAVPPFHAAENACRLDDLVPGVVAVAKFPVEVEREAVPREYLLACELMHGEDADMISFPVVVKRSSFSWHVLLQIMLMGLAVGAGAGLFMLALNRRKKTLRRRRTWR